MVLGRLLEQIATDQCKQIAIQVTDLFLICSQSDFVYKPAGESYYYYALSAFAGFSRRLQFVRAICQTILQYCGYLTDTYRNILVLNGWI